MLIKESENCRELVYKATNQHTGLANIEEEKNPSTVFSNIESGNENMSE